MAELYSQYFSGTQFPAGDIVGSALGVSGMNPIIDRLNSISQSDNNILITGSFTNNKTSYYSLPGQAFRPMLSTTAFSRDDVPGVDIKAGADSVFFQATVNLPNGVVVTAAIVDGDPTPTWSLVRSLYHLGTINSTMATATMTTEDSSITDATIDNQLYTYAFQVELDTNEYIDGARITYTTDYD